MYRGLRTAADVRRQPLITHHLLLGIVRSLPTDYQPWGDVDRDAIWQREEDAPDCSCGCKWALDVEGKLGMDWVVCCRKDAPTAGLLRYEHQSGFGCFEKERT